jgi:predicted TIM-barrel fold metal-dependent hydrolase
MARYQGRIVDAHQHVCWIGRNEKDFIKDLDRQRIDMAWALTWESVDREGLDLFRGSFSAANALPGGGHRGMPLSEGLKAKERYPDRIVLGYCPDPLDPGAAGMLAAAHDMYGAQVCGEWKYRVLADDPRCLNLFKAAGALKMPVVVHLDVPFRLDEKGARIYDVRWYGGTVDNLERAVIACPGTVFIGHGPGFWREISRNAEKGRGVYPRGKVVVPGRVHQLLRRYRNLYADMSANSCLIALKRDVPHARRFLKEFPDRLLFGRDCHTGDLFKFLDGLGLPDRVMQKICFRNAEKLVKPDRSCRWA